MPRGHYKRKTKEIEAAAITGKPSSFTSGRGVQMNITVPRQSVKRWKTEAREAGIPFNLYVSAKMNGGNVNSPANGKHGNPTVQAVSTIFAELEKLEPAQQKNVLKFVADAVDTSLEG